jgi:NodT family efflux transporter outer membrane factor (OMF) lipoprotein
MFNHSEHFFLQSPRYTHLAAIFFVATLLQGCASAPTLPAKPVTETTAAALSPWWRHFNDPLLSQLTEQALQANTSIRSAQAALQQSRALRDVKSASLLPSLTASGSAQRAGTDATAASNSFRAGLDARWELDVFGANQSALNASEADTLAAQASLADAQVSVTAEVALAYIQLRGLQAQLTIAQNNLASQQQTLQITEWRAQAGLITALEVAQARTAAEQTQAQIPTLNASLAKTRHSLAVLSGQRPLELDALLKIIQPVPQTSIKSAHQIPAQTLRQRPDVRAAEQRISAALARVSAADAARYPSFNLGGSLGLSALTLAGLTSGASLASSILGSISVPLLDAGVAKNQVLAQEAALEQARATYQNTVLSALKDVEDALITLASDQQRQLNLQSAADAADNAAQMAMQRYTSGLIDFQTVLQTQRTQLSAQDNLASVQVDISSDHVRLVKALGGGWP